MNINRTQDAKLIRLAAKVKTLEASLDAERADAERFRFLEREARFQSAAWGYHPASFFIRIWDNEDNPSEESTIRAFVDAAMAREKK